MAFTDAEFQTAIDDELGDLSTLATAAQKRRWFNAGQARMHRYYKTQTAVTWNAADREKALPTDFVQVERIVYNDGTTDEPWLIRGKNLVIDDEDGAAAAGGARVYYDADWPLLPTASAGSRAHDEACLAFALSRFWHKLASNRSEYRRYATLVGANAIQVEDLQSEADRYYNDFLDAREDIPPPPPVAHLEG